MKGHEITEVEPGSPAELAELAPGDVLLSINGRECADILEYRYLTAEYEVLLEVRKKNGELEEISIENDYADLGITFESGLLDKPQSCRNKCIFCFIDQLPKGMRETVYFKDDDTRLSFLQGNYVTLTNLSDTEIDRLISMRISPINISVHTTNPELRKKMLNNKNAGKLYEIMQKFSAERLYMNCQIVLCPGYNDGAELDRTIADLAALAPWVESLSVVPVGLTRYREGLCELTPFDAESSARVIEQVENWQKKLLKTNNNRMVYLSDEFYLNAGMEPPPAEQYGGFPQLENGVGLIASVREEFFEGLKRVKNKPRNRRVAIATGELAYEFIKMLASELMQAVPGVFVEVYPVKNEFFGGGVNVAGLLTGGDLIRTLKGRLNAEVLLITSSMLRSGEDVFLDNVTLEELCKELEIPIEPVDNDGYLFIERILSEELDFSE